MVLAAKLKVKPLKSKLRGDLQRFEEKVIVEESTDCWLWTGASCQGYGVFRHTLHNYAHRFSYCVYNAESIPSHLEVDHLCHNTLCVNPDHLQLVSSEENISNRRKALLGSGIRSRNHCVRNHPYSEGSFYSNKEGHRVCRECQRIRDGVKAENKRVEKKGNKKKARK